MLHSVTAGESAQRQNSLDLYFLSIYERVTVFNGRIKKAQNRNQISSNCNELNISETFPLSKKGNEKLK